MHLDLAASSGPLPLDRVDNSGLQTGDITRVWWPRLTLLLRGETHEVQEELCRGLADRGVLEEHEEIRIRLKYAF